MREREKERHRRNPRRFRVDISAMCIPYRAVSQKHGALMAERLSARLISEMQMRARI